MAGKRTALGKASLMAALALAAPLAKAQPATAPLSPPASPSSAPSVAVAPSAPSTSAAPTIMLPTPPPVAMKPAPRTRVPTRAPVAAPAPTPSTSPATPPSPDGAPSTEAAGPIAEPNLAPQPDATPVNATEPGEDWRPLAIAGGGTALAIGAALLFWRRRRRVAVPTIVVPEPVIPEPLPTPPATPRAEPAPAAAPTSASAPTQPVAEPLALVLEATRMSATLVTTTLAYRLIVVNRSAEPLTDIAIGGDMTAAHASKPTDEQLGLAGPEVPPLHHIDHLDAGAEYVLSGEMRLPLSAVTPIRHGEAALFVPLARLEAWASAPGGAIHARAAYIVGQEAVPAAERLQPFRLDLGPRIWSGLGQRALALPAG